MVAALKVVRFLAVRVIYLNSINLMGLSCHQLNPGETIVPPSRYTVGKDKQ